MIAALPQRASPGVDAQVQDERIRLLYRQAAATITGGAGAAVLLAGLMWPHVALSGALAWCIVFAIVTVLRYGLIAAHAPWQARAPVNQWEWLFTIGALFAGIAWGLGTLWLFPVLAHVAGISGIVFCLAMVVIGMKNARMVATALRLQFTNLELVSVLETLATRDSLTGLPNRLILVERLTSALKRADRGEHDVAIAFIDCDGFKNVNDTYGHAAGDEYLKHVARLLLGSVREVDTVARLGGDEFIVLLERCGDRDSVVRIVQRILAGFSQEMRIAPNVVKPRVSIGVTCYPRDGTDPEILIQQADEAMYAAKRAGGNDFRFFSPAVWLQA